jgi:hypothetical protein
MDKKNAWLEKMETCRPIISETGDDDDSESAATEKNVPWVGKMKHCDGNKVKP